MKNQSLWTSLQQEEISFPTLKENLVVDIVIIGGGITGITTAFELIKQNKKVVVIESDRIGWGTTGFSTGNLYIPVQPYYQNIKAKFDESTANLIIAARKNAIDYIEDVVTEHKIQCHFSRRPWYMYTNDKKNIACLEKEFEIFKNANLDVNYVQEFDIPFKFKKAVLLENQARFNPVDYVKQLAKVVQNKGGLIFEHTPVETIQEKNQCVVKTTHGNISAEKVIIATHTPKGVNHVQFFIAPYRSYAVAVKLRDGNYPKGHYWELDAPTYITSTHATESKDIDMLVVAGQHHKVGQCEDCSQNYEKIKDYIRQNYQAEERYQWSAQHYQAADDIPYIGYAHRKAKNVFLATGFFADGLTYGVVAGILLADLMMGKENSLTQLFSPERFNLIASAKKLIKENANVFYQYAKDLPFNVSAKNLDEIKTGEGKTIEIGGEKCAAFRDDNNKLHIVSAVCTHMKCVVNWNNAERTWDCPCHGSRFSVDGKVIEGPAYDNLPKKQNQEG